MLVNGIILFLIYLIKQTKLCMKRNSFVETKISAAITENQFSTLCKLLMVGIVLAIACFCQQFKVN